MAQEETQANKELLLKDLCARVPYGVIGQCEIDASYDTLFEANPQTHRFNAVVYGILEEGSLFVTPLIEDQDIQEFANEEVADGVDILDFKPYLSQMSSMTDYEKIEWHKITIGQRWITENNIERCIDWLNSHHFDYRGLIEKGLAIEAPVGMYEINTIIA